MDEPAALFDLSELAREPLLIREEVGGTHRRRVRPKPPDSKKRPQGHWNEPRRETGERPPRRADDPELWAVRDELLRLDPQGLRVAAVLRRAYDQLYDGRSTGRWDITQLSKTERTHLGSMVEIAMQREFGFGAGDSLDFSIASVDVDCKWSQDIYRWQIPREMYEKGAKIAMVVWANEDSEAWRLGLIRVEERLLSKGRNQDSKATLSRAARSRILWVWQEQMIANIFVRHPDVALDVASEVSGQQGVVTLFRGVQRELVTRSAVETAGQQVDSAKRVRDARKLLAEEGIVVFGHYAPHPDLAEALGLPRPTLGRFVSARVAPGEAGSRGAVQIDGGWWRLATEQDPVTRAPQLPSQGR